MIISILDLSLSNLNLSFIKIIRLLRILRPLRFISHNVNLKVIVNSLFNSIKGILNVFLVILLIYLILAIIFMDFMKDLSGYCDNFSGLNKIP